jgi:pre-mRNA-processing factor 40
MDVADIQYINGILAERRAAKEARIERLRPMFFKMFEHSPDIKPYSTMKTALEEQRRKQEVR